MKLDLNAAWDQAVRLVGMNREVLLVLGGVFFFLPYALFMLTIPTPEVVTTIGTVSADRVAYRAAVNTFLKDYWWSILLLLLCQSAGAIAVMAIIGDPKRPTVKDAVRRGGRFLPTAWATQLLSMAVIMAVLIVVAVLGGLTGSRAITTTVMLMAIPIIAWLLTRFSLSNAVIGIERTGNPLAALRRSWRLTSGNSLRLIGFFLLLGLAYAVVSQVLTLLFGLLTAMAGEGVSKVLSALFTALLFMASSVLFYAIIASIHRQLARLERTRDWDAAASDPL